MQERKKPLFQARTLIDIVLGGACIALLFLMLAQLDSLKKIEADIDQLRTQVENRKAVQAWPADRKQGGGSAVGQGKQ